MAEPCEADLLGRTAVRQRGRAAVIEALGGLTVTWGQLIEQRNRLASALAARGVVDGDRIIVYGYNGYGWILARATVQLLNCYFVPMNWHLAAPEVAYIVHDSSASVVLIDGAFAEAARRSRLGAPELWSKVRSCVVWGVAAGDVGAPLDALLEKGSPDFPSVQEVRNPTMAYTGGTTGKPKAVVKKGRPIVPGAFGFFPAAITGPEGLNVLHADPVVIMSAPLYHAAPGAWLVGAMAVGATMVTMRKFDPLLFLSLVAEHKVQSTVMPPILVKRITDLPEVDFRAHDLSSLKSIVSAGAACPNPIKEAALRLGIPLYEFYGSSELGINSVLRSEDMLRKPGSCGSVAPGVQVRIIDDAGRDCPPGTPGVLYVKVAVEYLNAEQKSEEARLATDPSFATVGDVAYLDEDNFIYICDRKIDMIISGGVNIYPAEIEECLFRHPDIADVAVFGTPDEEYGERVHAAVLLKEGRTATEAGVQTFARESIAGFKVPRAVSFHTDFPRTPAGKLLKRQLRDEHWRGRSKL